MNLLTSKTVWELHICNLKLNFACICREVNEEFLEFECHLKFDHSILKSGTLYEYCVCGADHPDKSEYLHDVNWKDNTIRKRYLRVPVPVSRSIEKGKNCFQSHI